MRIEDVVRYSILTSIAIAIIIGIMVIGYFNPSEETISKRTPRCDSLDALPNNSSCIADILPANKAVDIFPPWSSHVLLFNTTPPKQDVLIRACMKFKRSFGGEKLFQYDPCIAWSDWYSQARCKSEGVCLPRIERTYYQITMKAEGSITVRSKSL